MAVKQSLNNINTNNKENRKIYRDDHKINIHVCKKKKRRFSKKNDRSSCFKR